MTNKLALQIISIVFSDKKIGYPWNIREVYANVFPNKEFPYTISNSMFNGEAKVENHDQAKMELWEAAISHIVLKLKD